MLKQVLILFAIVSVAFAVNSQIVTLYAEDPVARTFSFTQGIYGLAMQDGGVYNIDSQIDFGNYNAYALTVGIQGNQIGKFVDLGTQASLAARYNYQETVGAGQGYASIQFLSNTSSQLYIRSATQGVSQPLLESADLFNATTSQDFVYPVRDHVILARISRPNSTFEIIVKMIILSGDSNKVSFRYDLIRSTPSANPALLNDTHIKTLYAYDPIMRTLSLSNGQPGLCWCGYTPECDYCDVCNCYSDIDFGWYNADQLSAGIEGGREAVWVDLGDSDNITQVYPNIQNPFSAISFANGATALTIGDVNANYTLNARGESTALFVPGTSGTGTPVHFGNLYLVRLTDSGSSSFERVALIMVIHHVPNVAVTVRYKLLRETSAEPIRADPSLGKAVVATLYAKDPITRAYNLDENKGGEVFDQGGVYNQNGQLDFNNYAQSQMSAGIQGAQKAVFLDIGTDNYLNQLYQGLFAPWAEIYYNSTQRSLYFITQTPSYVPLNQNSVFFAPSTSSGYVSMPIYQEHNYLLRLYEDSDPAAERIYKIKVIQHEVEEELTIRYLWLDKSTDAASSSDASSIKAFVGLLVILIISVFA